MSCFIFSNFCFRFLSLSPKSVFLTKLLISFLLGKFASADLAAKFSNVNLFNSWLVIYSSWLWWEIFFSISLIFVSQTVFFKKLLLPVDWLALTFSINSLHSFFLTNSFFTKSPGVISSFPIVNLSTLLLTFSKLLYQYLIYPRKICN